MLVDPGTDSLLAKPLLISRLKFVLKRFDVGIDQVDESFLDLLNPGQAADLQQQSIADASAALEAIIHVGTSWEARRDAVHFAFGSTAIVGLTQISTLLEQAEIVILNKDTRALAIVGEKLKFQLKAFDGSF